MIKEGEAVVELVIENPLRLWTNVPERYAEEVRVGQPVRISVASHPETLFEGKVVRINPSVDSLSRTFQVETLVPNDRRLLRPGGFAKATIVTDSAAQAAVVPIESIVRFAGVTKLFVVEDDKARAINDIVTGAEGRGWVEVSSKSLPASAIGRHHRPDASSPTAPRSSSARPSRLPSTASSRAEPKRSPAEAEARPPAS